MNIDEAIKLLNSIVKVNRHLLQGIENQTINQNEIQAIETLINEYNNLKQIEKAHRIENGKLRTKINELEREITGLKQTFTIHDDIDNHIPHID